MSVTLTILDNGNLRIEVDADASIEWDKLLDMREEDALSELIAHDRCNGPWDMVRPEEVAALTDAPIICEGVEYPDSGKRVVWGRCWWFPDYAVEDCILTLRTQGHVIFQWSGDPASEPVDCELCQRQGCLTCNGTGIILFTPCEKEEVVEEDIPPCVSSMGCLCAHHARGGAATDGCDARE